MANCHHDSAFNISSAENSCNGFGDLISEPFSTQELISPIDH